VLLLELIWFWLQLFYFSGQELPMFDNLVYLSIASDKKQGWQILPLLIKNSPNLETLVFKVSHDIYIYKPILNAIYTNMSITLSPLCFRV